MTISITGIAYLLVFLGLGLFAWRFFQSWQETEIREGKKSEVGRWLFYFFGLFTLLSLITAIGSLFFSKNTTILWGVVVITCFILALASAAAAYLIFYLLFPKIKPWYGFLGALFLGLTTTILTIFIPFEPFLEASGGINWDFRPPVSFLRFSLYIITFLPLSIIFLRQFYLSGDDEDTRIKSLALALFFSFVLIISYIEFILEPAFKLPALTSDIFILFAGIILLMSVFFPIKSVEPRQHKF